MLRLLRRNRNLYQCRPPRHPSILPHLSFLHNSITQEPTNPDNLPLSAAKKLRLKSTANSDAVLSLLKSHGFTDTQISHLIAKQPRLLSANPEKVIKPKLDFFLAADYSVPDRAKLVSADPNLLLASLQKRLRPNFDLLISVLAFSRSYRLLRSDLEKTLLPNMETLRDNGVPGDKITKMVTIDPRVLMQRPDKFGTTIGLLKDLGLPVSKIMKLATMYPRVLVQSSEGFVERVTTLKEQGFDPSSSMFMIGLYVMSATTRPTWERKLAVYRSLGWSEKETISAFTKHPFCMLLSDEKLRRAMNFFVKELNWEPSILSARPVLLSLSFEKRIVPRCAVMSVLSSRGLLSWKLGTHKFLMIPEKKFMENYVMKYKEQVPEVLEAYQGKLGL